MDKRHLLGKKGEALAKKFLRKKGYRIVTANFRNQYGEIDLIVEDGEAVVFVEVKTHQESGIGPPEWKVNWKKQKRLARVAESYLQQHDLHDRPCRFDVVGISVESDGDFAFNHIVNVF